MHGRYTCAWPLTSTKVLEHPSSGLSMDVTGPEGTTQTFFRHLFYNTVETLLPPLFSCIRILQILWCSRVLPSFFSVQVDGCVVLIKCFFLRLVQFDESSLDDSSFFFSTRAQFKKIVRLRRFKVGVGLCSFFLFPSFCPVGLVSSAERLLSRSTATTTFCVLATGRTETWRKTCSWRTLPVCATLVTLCVVFPSAPPPPSQRLIRLE